MIFDDLASQSGDIVTIEILNNTSVPDADCLETLGLGRGHPICLLPCDSHSTPLAVNGGAFAPLPEVCSSVLSATSRVQMLRRMYEMSQPLILTRIPVLSITASRPVITEIKRMCTNVYIVMNNIQRSQHCCVLTFATRFKYSM